MTMIRQLRVTLFTLIAVVLVGPIEDSGAVALSSDGAGQALIYPYYTVRASNGNAFNTYVSLLNHTSGVKALRVRFREGRNSREVAEFNLFLSALDVWTAAIVPTSDGARMISTDRSCTSPALAAPSGEVPGITFSGVGYVGDGHGDELDRVREGWIEVIEMATLTGASAGAATHGRTSMTPANCPALQGGAAVETAAPVGGLSGTLTLINVNNGMDFTLNADALSELSSTAFYRTASDPYPDFNAAEVSPVSVVTANGFVYRSTWNRGVDAVSAVLMRSKWFGEFTLDAGTKSRTDFVVTFPTRHHYVGGGAAASPFDANCAFPTDTYAGERIELRYHNREEFGGIYEPFSPAPATPSFRCGASTVVDFHDGSAHTATTLDTHVLGSLNRGLSELGMFAVGFPGPGWAAFTIVTTNKSLDSLETSSRMRISTGETTSGSHRYTGVPLTGFVARTFENGALDCGGGVCQGNYGGAFPLRYERSITPSN
ncbi:MAG: hypothetical protein IPH30_08470 [Betaproteobacteria bacterium]|nr:hypothetical protein [Betaproteobacteria bacterium]